MNMNITSLQPTTGESTFLSEETIILPAWAQGRVSTKGQVKEKVIRNKKVFFKEKASLQEQKKKCAEAILAYKGNCPVCYKPIRLTFEGASFAKGESGRDKEREDIKEISKEASNGVFKVLVTIDNDRLARKRATAVFFRDKLKELGVQIYSLAQPVPIKCPTCFDPLDDDTGLIVETLSDMKSQLDLSKIRRNYKIGMPKRIRDGKPSGSLAYGLVKRFRTVGEDQMGNDVLEEYYEWDREKTDIVVRIADEYLSGKGLWAISKGLNLDAVPSPQNKKWGRSAILHILKNPVYAGKIRFGWKPVKNGERKIQPIDKWLLCNASFKGFWAWDYYEKIQQEIKRRVKVGGRAVSSSALLIGILKCAYCKYSMFQAKGAKVFKNGKNYQWVGYACGTYFHRGICKHNGIKQGKIDRIVLEEVLKLANKSTRDAFYKQFKNSKKVNYQKSLKQKEKRLDNRLKQFSRINKAYMEGIDTLEEYSNKKSEILPEIETLKQEIQELSSKIKNPIKLSWRGAYEEALKRFMEYPNKDDMQKARLTLSRLIDRVEFRKKPFSVKVFYKTD